MSSAAMKESTSKPVATVRPGTQADLFKPNTAYKLLLAIENDDNAPAAIRLTNALAARGAIPTVLRTIELMTAMPDGVTTMMHFAEAALGAGFRETQERDIAERIDGVLGGETNWPIRSAMGDAAPAITAATENLEADALVIGIHRHGAFSQALGENTATRVMTKTSIPMIGVRPDSRGLPRRIMVATDFGNASVAAAHLAANLAEPGGVVILVNVSLPFPVVEEGDEGAALVQREGVEHAFLRLAEQISAGKAIRVETVARSGDAGAELLAAAEHIGPDMIAVARERHHLVARMMLGSVSRGLVRNGRWSMLITPPLPKT